MWLINTKKCFNYGNYLKSNDRCETDVLLTKVQIDEETPKILGTLEAPRLIS